MKKNKKLDILYIISNIINIYINKCLDNKKIVKKYKLNQYENTLTLATYLLNDIDVIKNDIVIDNFLYDFCKKHKKEFFKYTKWKREFKNTKNKKNYYLDLL
jgi:hypothetical protein